MADPEPDKPAPVPSRSDLALMRRAARERWGVPDQLKTEAIASAWEILADPDAKPKLKLAAMRLLSTFHRADQADDKLDIERSKLAKPESIDARAALLAEALEITRGHTADDGQGQGDGAGADPGGHPGVPA